MVVVLSRHGVAVPRYLRSPAPYGRYALGECRMRRLRLAHQVVVLLTIDPFVSDLGRPLCHYLSMTFEAITPMHHLTIVGSSVASGLRRQRSAWPLSRP